MITYKIIEQYDNKNARVVSKYQDKKSAMKFAKELATLNRNKVLMHWEVDNKEIILGFDLFGDWQKIR